MKTKPINREELIVKLGHVMVLMGGDSPEREISLLSGAAVFESLQRIGVDSSVVDAAGDLSEIFDQTRPALIFNMLHGRGGEDGVLQGYLETLGIPYTGSGVLSSALAMDKVRSKLIWQQLGLSTAPFAVIDATTDFEEVIATLGKVVVKPVNGGSSLGIAISSTASELKSQFETASQFDDQVFAETYLAGREFSTGIVGEFLLPTIQLETDRQFFDFEAKYVDEETRIVCPPQLDEEQIKMLEGLVKQAYNSLGCKGMARVDVMQDEAGKFSLLELNTVPGMTNHSFIPMAAAEAGMNFDDLITYVLDAEISSRGQH